MSEEWKIIEGSNGNYQVSTTGRIKSDRSNIIMKPWVSTGGGYMFVRMMYGGERKNVAVHRLVALAFIPNPFNKKTVNHIDGNKLNNHASNLEWATHSENVSHAYRNGLAVPFWKNKSGDKSSRGKEVFQFDLNNNLIGRYGSILEAARKNSINAAPISLCANGIRSQAYGFRWAFENKLLRMN